MVATELAMALAREGDEVHVISYALPFRLELVDPRLTYHEVQVPRYPLFEYPPYSLALATQIVEVARHQKLDLVHVHYAVPNAVSAVLAREILEPQELKVVTTLHGTDITLVGNDPNYLETTRWGIDKSDAVTAVSESLRAVVSQRLVPTADGNGRIPALELLVINRAIDEAAAESNAIQPKGGLLATLSLLGQPETQRHQLVEPGVVGQVIADHVAVHQQERQQRFR